MTRTSILMNFFGAALTMGLLASGAQATTVDPTAGTFGQLTRLDGSTDDVFTGMGIPSDQANFTTVTDRSGNTIRFGLAATPRFSAPAVTNDGAGTYTAQGGVDANGIGLWNFSFFIEISDGLSFADLEAELLYDLDPTAGTMIGDMGSISFDGVASQIAAGSQNSTFGFLSTGIPGFVDPNGQGGLFDPNQGEYSFLLRANGFNAAAGDGVGIIVNVVAPVPLPAGLPMLLAGLGLFGLMRRRARA